MATEDQEHQVEAVEPGKRKVVNLPLRIAPETHDVLRRIAYERRVSIHSLVLQGVAEVLRQHGK